MFYSCSVEFTYSVDQVDAALKLMYMHLRVYVSKCVVVLVVVEIF
jgi:hypothetical protein